MINENKDEKEIKELMAKNYDAEYLEQFAFAHLALLDIIDNDVDEKHKQRIAMVVERMKEPDLEPLQAKIDAATYELCFEDNFRGTRPQVLFVESRKNNLNLNRLILRKADNKLLTNYLIVNKKMHISKNLISGLFTNGHTELVDLIEKIQAKENLKENLNSHNNQQIKKVKVKEQTLNLKM